ncbi:MAG: hypothetical protein K5Q68_01800 [Roseococcus sp.]|nr:hypothetical protein [Roseococcus sp.]
MRGAALILAGLLAAAPARAQEEPRLGTPLPVMETVVCYTQRAAQDFIAQMRRRPPAERLPENCVTTLLIAIPQEIPPNLPRFEMTVRSYAPGATSCIEHLVDGVMRRIPVMPRRQPVRFVESHAIYEDGAPQDMRALVLIPQRPYALDFQEDPNRREAPGPCERPGG